ncbi:MAG TPA: 50S ribosomal protein L35 [Opitutales bacterium]|nr:50S ribosomal protein L35 [Opitutales bacterium]
MQKTRKSISKRYKVTGTGKVMRRSPGQRHLLAKKSPKQKRRNSRDKEVAPGQAKIIRASLPFGN